MKMIVEMLNALLRKRSREYFRNDEIKNKG